MSNSDTEMGIHRKIKEGILNPQKIPPFIHEKIFWGIIPHFTSNYIESVYTEEEIREYLSDDYLISDYQPQDVVYRFETNSKKLHELIRHDLSPYVKNNVNSYVYTPPKRFVYDLKDIIIDHGKGDKYFYLNDDCKAFGPFNTSDPNRNKRRQIKNTWNSELISNCFKQSVFPWQSATDSSVFCNKHVENAVPLLNTSNFYGHFLCTHLPKIQRAEIYKSATGKKPVILIQDGFKWQLEILDTLGIDKSDVLVVSEKDFPIFIKNFVYTDQKYIAPRRYKFCVEDLDWIHNRAINNIPCIGSGQNKRILVSRQNQNRRILNFNNVQEMLIDYNFQTIRPEEYSFEDQVRLFYNSDIVVGMTGSNLANTIFQRDSDIIGIHHRDQSHPFSAMAQALGNRWHELFTKDTDNRSYRPPDANTSVNVQKLEQKIKEITS